MTKPRMSDFKCSVEGCEDKARTKGLCNRHYMRVRIHGKPDDPPAPTLSCSVPGCNLPHEASGLCARHYVWSRRNGGRIPKKNVEDMRKIGGGRRDRETVVRMMTGV